MKLADVMTTQEAGERWNVPADSIKQCCLKRYANKQFTDDEARKSGRNWLVTRQGMTRLYGEEPKMLKVINCTSNIHQVMGTAETYKEAWDMIYRYESIGWRMCVVHRAEGAPGNVCLSSCE